MNRCIKQLSHFGKQSRFLILRGSFRYIQKRSDGIIVLARWVLPIDFLLVHALFENGVHFLRYSKTLLNCQGSNFIDLFEDLLSFYPAEDTFVSRWPESKAQLNDFEYGLRLRHLWPLDRNHIKWDSSSDRFAHRLLLLRTRQVWPTLALWTLSSFSWIQLLSIKGLLYRLSYHYLNDTVCKCLQIFDFYHLSHFLCV